MLLYIKIRFKSAQTNSTYSCSDLHNKKGWKSVFSIPAQDFY